MDLGFLKTLFFSLPVLVFVIWQLVSVTRELDADRKADEATSSDSADAGHSERKQ